MEMKMKKKQIDEIYTQEIQKKLMYTKQKYYKGGSQHARLLVFKLWKQQADNTVYCITDPTTKQIYRDIEDIINPRALTDTQHNGTKF